MKKNEYKIIKLPRGEVNIYRAGNISLHVYKTDDPLNNFSLVLEKGQHGVVIEPPSFVDNLVVFEQYLRNRGIKVDGLLLAYHQTGIHFMKEATRYSTRNAEEYGTKGMGKTMLDNYAEIFGSAFDASINKVSGYIEGDSVVIAGITLNICRNEEAFDIEIPEINARYIHMLGHDVHSIVGNPEDADRQKARLEDCIRKGYDLILTSHHSPEDLDDVRAKVDYLGRLKKVAKEAKTGAEFVQLMTKEYPHCQGEHYLKMTSRFLFG